MHNAKDLSVVLWRVPMLLKCQTKEGFPARLLLAASRDIHIIGISWDVYTLASKGMSHYLSN